MFSSGIRLGRIAGIPIHVDASWLIIFFLIAAALTFGQFRPVFPRLPIPLLVGLGLLTSLLFFMSVLLHELAHSMVARRFGIPVRNITLFLLGGVSQIEEEASSPSREFAIAIAGPACSVALAAGFAIMWQMLPVSSGPAILVAEALAGVNLVLAAFNLIPGFPLDGGRVFRSAIWGITGNHSRSTRIAAATGMIVAWAFIAGGLAFGFLWGGEFLANGLWLAFIGWFLHRAASHSYRHELLRTALNGTSVGQVMRNLTARVAPHHTLADVLAQRRLAGAAVVAGDDDEPRGVIHFREALAARRNRQDGLTVAEAMTPMDRVLRFSPETDVVLALERLDRDGGDVAAVIENGRMVGLLSREDIHQYGARRNGQRRAA